MSGKQKRGNDKKNTSTETIGIILIIIAAFFLLCLFTNTLILGVIGGGVKYISTAAFGYFAYAAFVMILTYGVLLFTKATLAVRKRWAVYISLSCFFFLCVLQLVTSSEFLSLSIGDYISKVSIHTEAKTIGGILFGIIAYSAKSMITLAGAYILFGGLTLLFIFLLGLDIYKSTRSVPAGRRNYADRRKQNKNNHKKESGFIRSGESASPVAPVINQGLYVGNIIPREDRITSESGTFSKISVAPATPATQQEEPVQTNDSVKKLRDMFTSLKEDAAPQKERINAHAVLFEERDRLSEESAQRFISKANQHKEILRDLLASQSPQMPRKAMSIPDIKAEIENYKKAERKIPEVIFPPQKEGEFKAYPGEIINAESYSSEIKQQDKPQPYMRQNNFIDEKYGFLEDEKRANRFLDGNNYSNENNRGDKGYIQYNPGIIEGGIENGYQNNHSTKSDLAQNGNRLTSAPDIKRAESDMPAPGEIINCEDVKTAPAAKFIPEKNLKREPGHYELPRGEVSKDIYETHSSYFEEEDKKAREKARQSSGVNAGSSSYELPRGEVSKDIYETHSSYFEEEDKKAREKARQSSGADNGTPKGDYAFLEEEPSTQSAKQNTIEPQYIQAKINNDDLSVTVSASKTAMMQNGINNYETNYETVYTTERQEKQNEFTSDIKSNPKPDIKPEVKTEIKSEIKPEVATKTQNTTYDYKDKAAYSVPKFISPVKEPIFDLSEIESEAAFEEESSSSPYSTSGYNKQDEQNEQSNNNINSLESFDYNDIATVHEPDTAVAKDISVNKTVDKLSASEVNDDIFGDPYDGDDKFKGNMPSARQENKSDKINLDSTSLKEEFSEYTQPVKIKQNTQNNNTSATQAIQTDSVFSDSPEDDHSGYYIRQKQEKETSFLERAAALDKKIDPKNQINIENYLFNTAEATPPPKPRRKAARYIPPPLELLTSESTIPEDLNDDLQKNADELEKVLKELKLPAKVKGITRGPAVTRYELEMPPGYTVKKVEGLSQDIAYALASNGGIRIEAPIPGKKAVGVEVPNKKIDTVGLREMIGSPEFNKASSHLSLCIGKDISGHPIIGNLEKMPHLLIAGSTGSGKSACLHSLIISMLYKASPADVRIILIDPKRVEFPFYKGLRHLMINTIINEREHAINAFKWVREEMEQRYKHLAKHNARNLQEYNSSTAVKSGETEKLPNIVLIVDELSDLMQGGYRKEMEEHILSIAQLARASGVHLIIATQRPSVDVITGTIKVNLPSRIALAVANSMDSKTILDQSGAEMLLGSGDLLFAPIDAPEPKRIQGAYVTREEVESIVAFINENNPEDFYDEAEEKIMHVKETDESEADGDEENGEVYDGLLEDVSRKVIETNQASTSMIQRRFKLGYARASRIMDQMERFNFIGAMDPNRPTKPREVYITREMFKEFFGKDY